MSIMPYSLVRLKVADYAKFKPVFDEVSLVRKAHGSKGGTLFQEADSSDKVTVLLEWDTLENARKFYQSDEIKKALQKSGNIKIDVYYLNKMENVSA
jgi:heme-degrading monooxygenase HmoA